MKIFLSYNAYKPLEIGSYLSAGIRLVTYFKGRGQHDSVKWNHCGATDEVNVWEALVKFTKHPFNEAMKPYEKLVILKPTFDFDKEKFTEVLNNEIGKTYNFWAIFCQLIYQTTGKKIQKEFKNPYCSQSIAKAFYLSTSGDIQKEFENHNYIDPQDFVRMWKKGMFKR